jgi:hypothetical protein
MDRKIIRYRKSSDPLSGGEVTCPGEDVAQIVFALALAFDRVEVETLKPAQSALDDQKQKSAEVPQTCSRDHQCAAPSNGPCNGYPRNLEQPVTKIDPGKAKGRGCKNGLVKQDSWPRPCPNCQRQFYDKQ